jgi:putative ABC transport system permease protein
MASLSVMQREPGRWPLTGMLYHLKFAIRRLLRQKGFSLINVLGLSIGVAACLLIYLYVHTELSYDGYNLKKDRIVRLTSRLQSPETVTLIAGASNPLPATLVREFPDVESAVHILPSQINIRQGTEVLKEPDVCFSEESLFGIFSFDFLEGTASGALQNPGSIVLSRTMAQKYFGASSAVGRTLVCNGKPCRVTAVFADRPANSDITMRAILYKDFMKDPNWVGSLDANVYVLFRNRPNLPEFTSRLNRVIAGYVQPQMDSSGAKGYSLTFEAEMLQDVHFSAGKLDDQPKGNRQFNSIFSALALFILLIAVLNYVNLATTKAIERRKEIGVLKTIGARPAQLMRQFLGESSVLVALASLLAVGFVAAAVPLLNGALETHLVFDWRAMALFMVLFFPLILLGAGLYPAVVLSRQSPLRNFRSNEGILFRKILTVLQFIIALIMLTGAAIIHGQMQYIAHKDLGADRSQVLSINFPSVDQIEAEGGNDSLVRVQLRSFSRAIRQISGVREVSTGSGMPVEGAMMASTSAWKDGRRRELFCRYFNVDPVFVPMLKIAMAKGRNFSDSFPTDKKEAFIVNEVFVQNMGWKEALGQHIEGAGHDGRVIGVVKNFFYSSLHNAIEPMALVYNQNPEIAALVRTDPRRLPRLREVWRQFFPSRPFDYYFLDENFQEQYEKDRMTMQLFNAFTVLALFISGLGLYGLVALIALRRTKEVGIRKVLGASMLHLVALLSREQVYLIGLAALAALPLAAIAGSRWLASFAWHSGLTFWMFLWPLVGVTGLALAVMGLRIIRTARTNPVESLRME